MHAAGAKAGAPVAQQAAAGSEAPAEPAQRAYELSALPAPPVTAAVRVIELLAVLAAGIALFGAGLWRGQAAPSARTVKPVGRFGAAEPPIPHPATGSAGGGAGMVALPAANPPYAFDSPVTHTVPD
jgi:hypothetical protein